MATISSTVVERLLLPPLVLMVDGVSAVVVVDDDVDVELVDVDDDVVVAAVVVVVAWVVVVVARVVVVAGCVVVVACDVVVVSLTTTVPVMPGWIVQRYANVPPDGNGWVPVPPAGIDTLKLSEVAVCGALSSDRHVTLSPALIVIVPGEKPAPGGATALTSALSPSARAGKKALTTSTTSAETPAARPTVRPLLIAGIVRRATAPGLSPTTG
jgi:hypothetical protein